MLAFLLKNKPVNMENGALANHKKRLSGNMYSAIKCVTNAHVKENSVFNIPRLPVEN